MKQATVLTSSNKHQVTTSITDGIMEGLVLPEQATNEKAETKTKQQVCKDTAQDGGLYDGNTCIAIVLDDDHEENDFNQRAKSCFQNDTQHLWQLACQLLPGKPYQICSRYHGDVRYDEDPELLIRDGPEESHGDRDKRPKHVNPFACGARAVPDNLAEVNGAYATSAALPLRLYAWCDLVSIVIEASKMHAMLTMSFSLGFCSIIR